MNQEHFTPHHENAAELPPELRPPHLYAPTAEQLAESYDIPVEGLPAVFEAHLRYVSDPTQPFSVDAQFNSIHELYKIWQASKEHSELAAFGANIASMEDLQRSYPDIDVTGMSGALVKQLKNFVLQPAQLTSLSLEADRPTVSQQRGMYNADGEWVRLPAPDNGRTTAFARRGVLDEAAKLEAELTTQEADVFHATGSAALEAILNRGALLSVSKLLEEGVAITSGEHISDDHSYVPMRSTVYMSNMMDADYSTERWFDEYPVIFGFLSETLAQQAPHPNYNRGLVGPSSDGHHAGEEVPLSMLQAIYVPKDKAPEVQAKIAEHGLPVEVISIEAAMVMREYSSNSAKLYANNPYIRQAQLASLSASEMAHLPSTEL
jgi:hypothetical protein